MEAIHRAIFAVSQAVALLVLAAAVGLLAACMSLVGIGLLYVARRIWEG